MSLKILVVDDEPTVLKLIKSIVEPLGYEVLGLADSRQAACRLESERFDGVVFDIRMPHLDGYELARRARASPLNGGAPVVMITGLNDIDTMRKCFSLGVSFFLNKPFTCEQLYSLFSAARGSMLRERRRHVRLPFCTTVECTFGKLGERHFRTVSLNLAESGMLLEPSGGLEVGQEVVLEFTLPQARGAQEAAAKQPKGFSFAEPPADGSGLRTIRAQVVRKAPRDRIAVQFTDLSAANRELIQRYIMGRVTF
jgi:CheY-like chemotaxis protein